MKFVKTILPIIILAVSIYFFRESYDNYGSWREWLALGDTSGAELYELNFQLYTPPAFLFFALGCFLVGRWWFR